MGATKDRYNKGVPNMTRFWWMVTGVVALVVVGAAAYFYLYPAPAPQVTIEEVVKGDGAFVFNMRGSGDIMYATYTGKTAAGVVFDDAHSDGKAPYEFTFDSPDLPPGWFIGINGMQIHGTRIITVPAALAHGVAGVGNIPPNQTLVYTVTLLNAVPTDDAGLVPPQP